MRTNRDAKSLRPTGGVVDAAIEVAGLTAGYAGAEIIRDVSFSVTQGTVLAVIGKNGMGKSTMLKAMMNIVKPWSGEVHLDGVSLVGTKAYEIARRGITYVPQEKAIFGDLSVQENLALTPARLPEDQAMAIAAETFPKLAQRRHQRAGTLSGGEQKMLLLARALVSRPSVLVIDEITEGLQPSVRAVLLEALQKERDDRGTAILLIEQDLSFAFHLADRFAVMKLGRLGEATSTAGLSWRDVAEEHLTV